MNRLEETAATASAEYHVSSTRLTNDCTMNVIWLTISG
jgi:hypothetical protein